MQWIYQDSSTKSEKPDWKNSSDHILAVQKTSVSRHHGNPTEDTPWNISDHLNTIVLRGLRETPNWSPMMLRDASFSDSRCELFQPVVQTIVLYQTTFPDRSFLRAYIYEYYCSLWVLLQKLKFIAHGSQTHLKIILYLFYRINSFHEANGDHNFATIMFYVVIYTKKWKFCNIYFF